MAAHPRWAMLRTTAHAVRPVSGLSGCCGRGPAALGAGRDGCGGKLHMGERRPDEMDADFRWNSNVLLGSPRLTDALPCAYRGVHAHGSASTYFDGHAEIAESCEEPASAPARHSSPMCNALLRQCHRTPTAPTTGSNDLLKQLPRQEPSGSHGAAACGSRRRTAPVLPSRYHRAAPGARSLSAGASGAHPATVVP